MNFSKINEYVSHGHYGNLTFFESVNVPYVIDTKRPKFSIPAYRVLGVDVCKPGDCLMDQPLNPSVACDGYGCVTIIRVPVSEVLQLEANVVKLLTQIEEAQNSPALAPLDLNHGYWRCAFSKDEAYAWAFIVDACTTYCNYGFLLDGTSGEITDTNTENGRDWTFGRYESINDAVLLSGDENSDNQCNYWLANEELALTSGVYQQLCDLGWIEHSNN